MGRRLSTPGGGVARGASRRSCADSSPEAVSRQRNGSTYTAAFRGILSTDEDGCAEYESNPDTDGGAGGVQFSELERFLDQMVLARDRVWIAGRVQLHKYTLEAQRSNIRMHQACDDRIYFDLVSPLGPLYKEPLTLLITVPDDWTSCAASQGTESKSCVIGSDGRVLIDAIPNGGRILLLREA